MFLIFSLYFFIRKTTKEDIMLFKKLKETKKFKKQSVLQLTALFLAAAFAIIAAACSENEIGGTENTAQTPTVADYEIGNLNQKAGSVIAVTITPRDGKSPGAVSNIKYAGNAAVPQEFGTYHVTFDVAAATGWNAATGLSAGNLIVGNPDDQTPEVGDYDINAIWTQTAGSVTPVTITPKDGKSTGVVTVYYQGIDDTEYEKSETPPTLAGTYAVTFDVAAVTGWNPASSLSAGTLIIEKTAINYISGAGALFWGVTSNALTLGLTPGDTTKEINLNWYSSGTAAGKVAKVRFVRGTFTAAFDLLEEEGTAANAGSSTQHKVTVKDLMPGASYQYAVSSDGENWSEAYDFKVPAATGLFKFAVITDPQIHASTWDVNNRYTPSTSGSKTAQGWMDTMEKIVSKGVSFIASCGDQVDSSGGNEAEYTSFFAPPGLRSLPLSPVAGNHDNHLLYNYHFNYPNTQTFSDETTNTVEKRNYFYLYNNILFVVLNTAPYPNGSNQSSPLNVEGTRPHIARYKSTIQAAKTKFPKAAYNWDWLIVQHHKSTASVADHCADNDIQGYVEAGFEKLMSDEEVDFVIAGHDHVYARSYPLSGRDGGKVSVPDKSKGGNEVTNPGAPIYFTFTTASGLKYYAVAPDPQFNYANTLYVQNNAKYPYLGEITGDAESTQFGSTSYMTKQYLPVSNYVFFQPYIPSYTIVEVNGKTIKFSTYPIVTAIGTSPGASQAYNYDADTPYDWVIVTKD
jgi:predicted phosphodiesterase